MAAVIEWIAKKLNLDDDKKKKLPWVLGGVTAGLVALYLVSKIGGKSGSRKIRKGKGASAADEEGGESQIWTVTVTKANADSRYGMVWKNTRQPGRCLKITDLKPTGAIAKMNKTLPESNKIRPGDFIRAVNHKRGYEDMRSELGAESLTLELERISKNGGNNNNMRASMGSQ